MSDVEGRWDERTEKILIYVSVPVKSFTKTRRVKKTYAKVLWALFMDASRGLILKYTPPR